MTRPSLRRSYGVLALWILLFALFLVHPATAHGSEDHDEDSSDGDDEDVDLKNSGLIAVKGYCLLIIFFATFLPGVSPYFLRWNETFLVLGTQFAAGVFLATAMLHFLPDSNETFEDLTPKTYPFASMLAVSGYLLIMLVDVGIQSVVSRQQVASSRAPDVESVEPTGAKAQTEGEVTTDPPEAQHMVKITMIHKASLGDAILLIFALCFHSIFEGIAIGVAGTKYDAWRNLWTISLHKVFAAIAMGIALLRIMPNRPLLSCAAYAFVFAISSPIGVGIGIAIDSTSQGATANWIYAISMGLATGIFIYVAINHLLSKGYAPLSKVRLDRPFFRFVAVTLGAGVLSVVMIWDD